MKKKCLNLLLFILFIFLFVGCQKKEVHTPANRKNYYLRMIVDQDDEQIYDKYREKDIYTMDKTKMYKVMLDYNGPLLIYPHQLIFEYDKSVVNLQCITTEDSRGYGDFVYYMLTFFKKCELTTFVVYSTEMYYSSNPEKYIHRLNFKVE